MREQNIWNTGIRFNLEDDIQKKAYDYLQNMDKEKFRSYSKVIAMAVVNFFDRYYKEKDDPYFETREREEQFISKIVNAVETATKEVLPSILLGGFLQLTKSFDETFQDHSFEQKATSLLEDEVADEVDIDWDFLE